MSNILNSHIVNNNNVIPAKPILNKNRKNELGPIVAPIQVSKFSLQDEIKKKEDFRRNVLYEIDAQKIKDKKKKSFFKSLLVIVAGIVSYNYFKGKV